MCAHVITIIAKDTVQYVDSTYYFGTSHSTQLTTLVPEL